MTAPKAHVPALTGGKGCVDEVSSHHPGLKGHNGLQGKDYSLYLIINSRKMKLCFKYCLEARSCCHVLQEPHQLMALISPTKDNFAGCLPLSSSFSIPTIINLLLQVYQENTVKQDGTTALRKHTASIYPWLHPGMKPYQHHATWSSMQSTTENLNQKQ